MTTTLPEPAQLVRHAYALQGVMEPLAVVLDTIEDDGLPLPEAVRAAAATLASFGVAIAANAAGKPTPEPHRTRLQLDGEHDPDTCPVCVECSTCGVSEHRTASPECDGIPEYYMRDTCTLECACGVPNGHPAAQPAPAEPAAATAPAEPAQPGANAPGSPAA